MTMSLVTKTLTLKPGRTLIVGWMFKARLVICWPAAPIGQTVGRKANRRRKAKAKERWGGTGGMHVARKYLIETFGC